MYNDKCKMAHTKPIKIEQYQPYNSLELFSQEMLWMLGSHQSPTYFAWINPTNSIVLELWKLHVHAYLKKSRKTKDYLKMKENLWI